jgi:hypothetical protein
MAAWKQAPSAEEHNQISYKKKQWKPPSKRRKEEKTRVVLKSESENSD